MKDFPDKELDNVFRDGNGEQDFPFNPDAWEKMDLLLDKAIQKRRRKRLFLWFALLSILFLTGSSIYYIHKNKQQSTEIHNEQIVPRVSNTFFDTKKSTKGQPIQQDLSICYQTTQLTTNKEKQLNSTKTNNKYKDYSKQTTDFVSNSIIDYNQSEEQYTALFTGKYDTDYTSNKSTIDTEIIDKNTSTHKSITPDITQLKTVIRPVQSINSNTVISDSLQLTLPAYAKSGKFILGLIAGHEWSSVGMMEKTKSGYKVGLQLAWQFKDRFQLSTAVVASKKKYSTGGTNYDADWKWGGDVVPMMVHGSCDVLEIPFEFTYYTKGYNHSSFFISGGLSSYFMHKEWYDYEYEPQFQSRTDLTRNLAAQSSNKHLMGISTFSVGYQQKVNHNFMIQIAPHINLPITGVGDGHVKLVTSGIQLKVLFGK